MRGEGKSNGDNRDGNGAGSAMLRVMVMDLRVLSYRLRNAVIIVPASVKYLFPSCKQRQLFH